MHVNGPCLLSMLLRWQVNHLNTIPTCLLTWPVADVLVPGRLQCAHNTFQYSAPGRRKHLIPATVPDYDIGDADSTAHSPTAE